MTVDDQVDPGDFVRDAGRDILAADWGRDGVVARRLIESGVQRDDDNIGAGTACVANSGANVRNDVADDYLAREIVAIPHHRTRRGGADDRDPDAKPRRQGPAA